jgi:hypothetical protein
LRLQRITEINLTQKFWERAIGTGNLLIDVQGEDDAVLLPFVRKPAIVQRVINSQINELVGGGAREEVPPELRPHDYRPAPPPPPPPAHDTPPLGVGGVPPEQEQTLDPLSPPTPTPFDPTPAPAPTTAGSGRTADGQIRDRLIELDDLRQRGIVSEEEFAAKKAELLDRL